MRLFSRDRLIFVAALLGLGCNGLAGIVAPSELPADANALPPDDGADAAGGSPIDADAAESEPVLDRDAASADTTRSDGPYDAGSTTIRFRDSSKGNSTSSTLEVSRPAFVFPGDLLLLTLYTDHLATVVTPPDGWKWYERGNIVNDFHSWWFYRFADGYEPPKESFGLNQETPSWFVYVAYSGVDPDHPFDNGTVVDTRGSPCVAPSIHPMRSSGLLFLTAFVNDEASVWGLINLSDPLTIRDSTRGVVVADFPQDFTGDTPPKSVSCTPAGDGAVLVMGLVPASP
ncbi:MAG TPA: hypothetical protein VF881_02535 [Polyangiaceae bacterium]